MARKSSVVPNELSKWYDRIKNAERIRSDVAKQYGWDRLKRELKGEYKSVIGNLKGVPIIPVNLVHAFIRTMVPSLYFRDPKFTCNPRGFQYINVAKIVEPLINYKWQRLKMKQETRKMLTDVGIYGHSWCKVGYTPVVGPAEPAKKTKKDGLEAKTPQYETDTVIKNEKIWAYRVSPNMVTFNNDESIDPPYDCRWICHEIQKPLETVKAMFPGNDELKPSFITAYQNPDDASKQRSFTGNQKDQNYDKSGIEMVRLREITDMDSGKMLLLADDYFKPLWDARDFPYDFDGFQWSMLKWNNVPDEPYPYADLYVAEPQIWEITKLLSMAVNHVKRFNRQLIMDQGALSKSEKAKFEQGVDGAIIEKQKGSADPAPVQYPPIQTDLYNILDRLQIVFDSVIGQSAFDRGSTTATKTRTLGEVGTIQRSTGARASERLDVLEDFLEEVAGKVIGLERQYTDVPEWVAVTGIDPEKLNQILHPPTPDLTGKMADSTGFQYTRKDLEGKVDISVVAGSTRPLDHDARNDTLIQIIRFGQALGLQPMDPASNEVGRELFQGLDMYGVAQAFEEKIKLVNAQQQLQQMTQQLQKGKQELQGMEQKKQQSVAQVQQLAQMAQAMKQGLNGGGQPVR